MGRQFQGNLEVVIRKEAGIRRLDFYFTASRMSRLNCKNGLEKSFLSQNDCFTFRVAEKLSQFDRQMEKKDTFRFIYHTKPETFQLCNGRFKVFAPPSQVGEIRKKKIQISKTTPPHQKDGTSRLIQKYSRNVEQ